MVAEDVSNEEDDDANYDSDPDTDDPDDMVESDDFEPFELYTDWWLMMPMI